MLYIHFAMFSLAAAVFCGIIGAKTGKTDPWIGMGLNLFMAGFNLSSALSQLLH